MNPPITVLMPAYNCEKYIGIAIDSVLRQTYGDFELLIVNDGSTDGTQKVIESYSDRRIAVINKINGGVSSALNTGLAAARGKYIARFDADDICVPERLQKQYDFMRTHPEYIMVGSDVDYITEEGDYIFTYANPWHTNEEITAKIMEHCPFVHSSVMYVKDAVLSLGGYEIKAHTFEDYYLWTKLVRVGKVCNMNEPLIKVRFNASSVTIDEKDHESIFAKLKSKALRTGEISDEEGKAILESIRKLDRRKKESSYNRMLGKKFLWNNYQPRKARRYLLKSIGMEPFRMTSYLLLMLSVLPEKMIKNIYEKTR
jgi:glycosyltransferase involved in cell wall biosynthesis